MAKINENTLAKSVTDNVKTGGPDGDLTIAQVRAVQKELLDQLACGYERSEVVALLEKHQADF